MNGFDILALFLGTAAVLAYANVRTLRLPATIGMLLAGLLGTIAVTVVDHAAPQLGIGAHVDLLLRDVNFSVLLLNGMLGFLLFAGSLTVDYVELKERLGTVVTLATAGTLISTAIVGAGTYFLFNVAGIHVPFVYCLLFGALISPTDPVAVLALLSELRAPRSVSVTVVAESLFNDGVGVVVYTALLTVISAGAVSTGFVTTLLLEEVAGGIAAGIIGGYLVYAASKGIDEPNIEVQLSFALVTALIALSQHLHISGPLACVAAGIFIGNRARHKTMRDETTAALDRIWSFADDVMNAVLFLILGLEAATFHFVSAQHLVLIVVIVLLVIGARLISVAAPLTLIRRAHSVPRGTIRILTWGGLRGGISVALALTLPPFAHREAVLTMTYAVVVFSIVVQGLTIERVIQRFSPSAP